MYKQPRGGFTLIELMIALAILSLLGFLFAGAYQETIQRQRSFQAIATFKTLFQFARHNAVYTQQATTVCALEADHRCSRDWGQDREIAVFVDRNNNRQLDAADTALKRLHWPAQKGLIRWRASLGRAYVVFLGEGNTWQNGTLYYCPPNLKPRYAAALVLSHSGRSYVPGDGDGDGIEEDRQGNNLHCRW